VILASTNPWVLLAATATRTLIVAFVLIVALRLFGKRQLSGMNVYDLAMIMAMANAVQNAMTIGSGRLPAGIGAAGSLFVLCGVLSLLLKRSSRVERNVNGSPILLVYEGRLLHERAAREGVTMDEIMQAVREHGFSSLSDVLIATLEVDGSISVVGKDADHRRHPGAIPGRQLGPTGP
jgi:uncharacterized membrane protein YcaP (DUF421 family)